MPKKTLEHIKASGNELIVQLKANQPHLLQQAQDWVEDHGYGERYRQPGERRHGRFESREVELYPLPCGFGGRDWQGQWKVLVVVQRYTQVRASTLSGWTWRQEEKAYYLSTCILSAERFAQAIRQHWHVENSLHHVLDVSMEEDRCRCRLWPTIWGAFRRTALNLMYYNGETSIRDTMYRNTLNPTRVLNYKGI